jgi:hypothetical protein
MAIEMTELHQQRRLQLCRCDVVAAKTFQSAQHKK